MPFGIDDKSVISLTNVFASFDFISEVIIYGSRAKGNYKAGSDVDLTIKGNQLTLNELTKISLAIEDLDLPWKIDLSLFHQIENLDLLDHIKRVGIIFYVKNY